VKRFSILVAVVIIATSILSAQTSIDKTANDKDSSEHGLVFRPNTLVLSRSVYAGDAGTVSVGQTLPPGCVPRTVTLPLLAGGTTTVKVKCATAVADGTYPTVFNNDGPDGSFGITSPIFLDNLTTRGEVLGTLPVPAISL
jgi:hypothetical protein